MRFFSLQPLTKTFKCAILLSQTMNIFANNLKLSPVERWFLAGLCFVLLVTNLGVHVVQADMPADSVETLESGTADAPAGFVVPPKALPKEARKTYRVDITAYTSTVEECDSSPFITADGSIVRDGIIATNILPFGTKVKIPKYFGDRIFEVRDRMNARYTYRIDIWMNDKKAMREWGLKRNAEIEVVEWGDGKKNWDQWKGRAAELHRIGKYGPPAES
jgi:3D (Asp-Asp-Asp) domain-containing protein